MRRHGPAGPGVLLALVLTLALPAPAPAAPAAPDRRVHPADVSGLPSYVQRVAPSIVALKVRNAEGAASSLRLGSRRSGSGVIFDARGYVLTVSYLLLDAVAIEAQGYRGRTVGARLVGLDLDTGLGVIKLEDPGPWPVATLGRSEEAVAGMRTGTVGIDDDGDLVHVVGQLQAIQRFSAYWEYMLDRAFVISPASPGWGGSAVVNERGEVVGVVSLRLGEPPYTNLAIPIEKFVPGKDELIGAGRIVSRPPRPWLGLYAVEAHGGPFVSEVSPLGPPPRPGVLKGDRIVPVTGVPQLQSARWVFPAAEHSRFQHSLGAMHLAGRMAQQLYPSLRAIFPEVPSAALIEELLRVAGLLHDVGHGPFGHFFDDNFLVDFDLTHELVGQRIIREELADVLRDLRRSPSGRFNAGEAIDPEWICYLMGKTYTHPLASHPKWLPFLKPLLSGVFTADNMDYVLRDAYMCGVAVGPIDIERIIYYSFFSEKGLTLDRGGLQAFTMFLNARFYMYTNVYYPRTTRGIDLHLKEIFRDTMRIAFPYDLRKELHPYLHLTEWTP